MPLESKNTEIQLYNQLISSLVHSVWVGLGQTENPLSNQKTIDLDQAATNIDMLDMLFKRMDGNLTEPEEQYLDDILRELKAVYYQMKDSRTTTKTKNSKLSKD